MQPHTKYPTPRLNIKCHRSRDPKPHHLKDDLILGKLSGKTLGKH